MKISNKKEYFGEYGGAYAPETGIEPLAELEAAYLKLQHEATFKQELQDFLTHFIGRPTPLYFAKSLTQHLGGTRIYLKRENLTHTGAHKINNTVGQGLLAKHMGKPRLIAEAAWSCNGNYSKLTWHGVCRLYGSR